MSLKKRRIHGEATGPGGLKSRRVRDCALTYAMALDSPLVQRARTLARIAHRHQVRKASGAPYFTHLQGVAQLLVDHGYHDDEMLAAAYLHDLVEDQPEYTSRLHAEMPHEVVDIVLALTERKLDALGNKRPKAERFAEYLAGLQCPSPATAKAIPISCVDRIHNAMSIVQDQASGQCPFMQLSTRPGELKAQLDALRAIYAPVVHAELLVTFEQALRALTQAIERWLPGRAGMIAAEAHLGRLGDNGEPYLLCLARVASAPSIHGSDACCVAFLDGLPASSGYSLERLEQEGFSPATLAALAELSRRDGEAFESYIARVAQNELAARIKLQQLLVEKEHSETGARARLKQHAIATLSAALR